MRTQEIQDKVRMAVVQLQTDCHKACRCHSGTRCVT